MIRHVRKFTCDSCGREEQTSNDLGTTPMGWRTVAVMAPVGASFDNAKRADVCSRECAAAAMGDRW